MPKANVLDMNGSQVGEIELSDAIFGIEPNEAAVHATVKNYLANQRQGTQSALTRSEVRGGGIKPWRQKGTGRARQGSIRAPQWTHGGVVFAPKPRSYRYRINKKVRRLALKSALSAKFAAGDIIVIDAITVDEIKTKTIRNFLKAIDAEKKPLLVLAGSDEKVRLSARNLPTCTTAAAALINTYAVLNCDKLIVDKAGIEKIEEVFA